MTDRDEDKFREQSQDAERNRTELASRENTSRGTATLERSQDATQRGERTLDDRIQRVADDPKGLASAGLKDGTSWREALDKKDPADRREYREQLTAEVLSKEVFCKEGYERYSGDRSDGTRASKWEELHDSEKLAAFRDAEQLTARIEDRDLCRLSVSDTDRCGSFNPEKKTIDLDHSKTMDYRVSEKQAMETFFHEQAHAKQGAAIEKPGSFPEVDASQRETMRENFKKENYKPGGGTLEDHIAYRDQLIERNARDEAKERLARVEYERRRQEQF